MIKSCITQCNHILQKASVPTVAFSLSGRHWEHTWIKYLNIPAVAELYYFKEEYHNFIDTWDGHLTTEGNKEFGLLLRKELDNVLSKKKTKQSAYTFKKVGKEYQYRKKD